MELLPRFELGTSSLPIRQNKFCAVLIRVTKYPQVPVLQGLAGYYVLAYLSLSHSVCWTFCWKVHHVLYSSFILRKILC